MELNGFNNVVLMFGLQHPEMNIIYVFSYYNAKINVYATSITGIKSKVAALLFAPWTKFIVH